MERKRASKRGREIKEERDRGRERERTRERDAERVASRPAREEYCGLSTRVLARRLRLSPATPPTVPAGRLAGDAVLYVTSVRRWDQQCLSRFRSRSALRLVVLFVRVRGVTWADIRRTHTHAYIQTHVKPHTHTYTHAPCPHPHACTQRLADTRTHALYYVRPLRISILICLCVPLSRSFPLPLSLSLSRHSTCHST